MGKITTKKRILFSFRGQVTINGQIMSEKPGIFCAQNGQKLWVFGQPGAGELVSDNSFMAAVSKKKTAAMKEKLAAVQGNVELRNQGQGLRS